MPSFIDGLFYLLIRRFSISEWGFGFWESDKFRIYMILRKELFERGKIKKVTCSFFSFNGESFSII